VVLKVKSFGSFRLDTANHCLWRDAERVSITPKAYDVLCHLVVNSGRLVTPDEMLQAVWTDTYVNPEVFRKYIREIRRVLGDKRDDPQFVETVPKRGYRFIAPVSDESEGGTSDAAEAVIVSTTDVTVPLSTLDDAQLESLLSSDETSQTRSGKFWEGEALPAPNVLARVMSRAGWMAAIPVVLAIVLIAVISHFYFQHTPKLTDKDMVVLADFANSTGDPVFDDTLKQALSVQLLQSPFLNVLPDRKVEDTLRLMGRPGSERVTRDVARELCVRTGSKAIVLGSISNLGGQYVVGINALSCNTGETLASEEEQASTKHDVLRALSKAAAKLRGKLGESLASVQKFDVPFEATTTSLEALQAYTMGVKAARAKGDTEAIPFEKRAIDLDPNFALAYANLGLGYSNLGQSGLAEENIRRAYALRDRVSEREKYRITAFYYTYVTRELELAAQAYQLWAEGYPRDPVPLGNLAVIHGQFGQYEKCVSDTLEGLRLEPNDVVSYINLGQNYVQLNRGEEAEKWILQAQQRNLDAEGLHWDIYQLAFFKGDTAEMERQVAWAQGKPGSEDLLLSYQSDTEAYYGRLVKARDLSRRAVDSALRNGSKQNAALWRVNAALREAEFGNAAVAKQEIAAAQTLGGGRDIMVLAALAWARIGDTTRAKSIAEELEKKYPSDTIMRFYWLPTISAAIELDTRNPAQAVIFLEAAEPYELGWPPQLPVPTMYPVYLRGQAYLAARNGAAAAKDFQKFLDHRGVVLNYPLGALARLRLARAYAVQAQSVQGAEADAVRLKARAAYQDFLTLWKGADPDIPILKQAKAEYAKLQ